MQVLTILIKTISTIILITFCAVVATIILAIIMPENVEKVIEIIKSILTG